MPALKLSKVRSIAKKEKLVEIDFKSKPRVVSFAPADRRDCNRINVYWTTGTVGTCLNHPRQGKTQLFRRNMDLKTLRRIFSDPRVHTGVGYHRVTEKTSQMTKEKENEEKNGAARNPNLGGRFIMGDVCDFDDVEEWFDETVTSIACGGDATILLYEDGSWKSTSGLPTRLYNKLKGRQKSLPRPVYVAIGSMERYYIRFEDGKSQWVGCSEMSDELQNANKGVKCVAFGEDWNSYCIVYDDGDYDYEDVPDNLDKLLTQRNLCDIKYVSLGPDGEYYVSAKNGRSWRGGMTEETLKVMPDEGRCRFLDFGDDDRFICLYT